MTATLVGIDCAAEEAKMGLARGVLAADGSLRVERATLGSAGESAAATMAGWIAGPGRHVVALDAPLGWPQEMGRSLSGHRAGEAIDVDGQDLFRRGTDRFVAERLRRTPPEVGADRVAHTALSALRILRELRAVSRRKLPLAWNPARDSGAIEVLPFATLRAHGLSVENYRGQGLRARSLRARIVDKIESLAEVWVPRPVLLEDSHLLDAVVAVIAAADFVRGDCYAPDDLQRCQNEGWIWVRARAQQQMFEP